MSIIKYKVIKQQRGKRFPLDLTPVNYTATQDNSRGTPRPMDPFEKDKQEQRAYKINNQYKSPILENITNQRSTSEVIQYPDGTVKTQVIGIQPTISPIDVLAGGAGALRAGGTKLLGSQIDLVNPVPFTNVSNLITKTADKAIFKTRKALVNYIDPKIKPRFHVLPDLNPKAFSGSFLNDKHFIGDGIESQVYKHNDKDLVYKFRTLPIHDVHNLKDRSKVFEELSGTGSPIIGYYKDVEQNALLPITRQKYIQAQGEATQDEINDWVKEKGLIKFGYPGYESYKYKNYVLSDLHTGNFIKTQDGKLHVIDGFVYKKPEYDRLIKNLKNLRDMSSF